MSAVVPEIAKLVPSTSVIVGSATGRISDTTVEAAVMVKHCPCTCRHERSIDRPHPSYYQRVPCDAVPHRLSARMSVTRRCLAAFVDQFGVQLDMVSDHAANTESVLRHATALTAIKLGDLAQHVGQVA
jgi:hypothetical protein